MTACHLAIMDQAHQLHLGTWRLWWRLWYQGLRDRASAVTSGTLFLVSNRSPCDAHRGIAARSPRRAGRCSQCRREIMRPVNGSSMIRPRTQAAPKLPAASFPTAPAMKAYYSLGFLLRRSIESREGPVMARGGLCPDFRIGGVSRPS
jgi:hypothetical protein